jgi:glyoxylase-like metal-dependent hydrolase (beta-lactamase superfamily II)
VFLLIFVNSDKNTKVVRKYQLKQLKKMKLHKIEAGTFHVDGGAIFGVVPKKVWQKRYPCNEENFCSLTMRCLLIDTGEKKILIDTGTGSKQLHYLKYYGFENIPNLDIELEKFGYCAADITDVVLTHLHFDHCGGCTDYAADGKSVTLTFPNATYWVGKAQWDNFKKPNVREGDSYFPENMLPIEAAGKLQLVSENRWLCKEVELRLFNGHTVGQLVGYIHTNNGTFVYVGDVIPVAASLPIAWISAYDTNPIRSMEEKVELLKEAVEKDQILFFEHDLYNECCNVEVINGKYKIKERFALSTYFSNDQ